MRYIPKTQEDIDLMLKEIGVTSVKDLFKDIPHRFLLTQKLNIPKQMSELEIKRHITALSEKNVHNYLNFLGAGAYQHFIPAIVNHLIFRSEFYTAYTPYQAEMSQGILQSLYEYQTMICELTGMDVSNASVYDGSSALAESCIMAVNIKKKNEILISKAVHPEYREVVKTYAHFHGIVIKEISYEEGLSSIEDIQSHITENTAGIIVQTPNFFGCIEDIEEISKVANEFSVLLIVCVTEPTSLGMLKSPGKFAEIVVGEGQSFGNAINFGGPYFGFMATKDKYVRFLSGRIVGATVDTKGRRGFTLTLQAREQHIRREKASSNICTSQVLNALAGAIYLASLGKRGVRDVAEQNVQKAHYCFNKLKGLGITPLFTNPFYNEFVIRFDNIKRVNEWLLSNHIIGGIDLGRFYPELKNCGLFCVTEIHSKEDIDRLVEELKEVK